MADATPHRLDWEQLLREALATPGSTQGIYNRFYDYSLVNRILLHLQGVHEPVATLQRWNALGRIVLKGSKAREIIRPILIPIVNDADEPEERLVGFKPVRSVFPYSETTGQDLPTVPLPGWDLVTAMGTLGIREVPFKSTDGNTQGWSRGTEFGINPLAANRHKTVFHELAHIVLGHTLPHAYDEYMTHRGLMEFEAESTAFLAMKELDQLDDASASESRAYIQHWLKDEHPPEKAIQHVFTATDRILKAGRLAVTNTVEEA
jgi:hypothetical protein